MSKKVECTLCATALFAAMLAVVSVSIYFEEPKFVELENTEWPTLKTSELGVKYPYIIVRDTEKGHWTKAKYDEKDHWYHAYEGPDFRITWMGGRDVNNKLRLFLCDSLDFKDTGDVYDLTEHGYVLNPGKKNMYKDGPPLPKVKK